MVLAHKRVPILVLSLFFGLIIAAPQMALSAGFAQCNCVMDPMSPNFCPLVTCVDTTNGYTTTGKCLLGPGPKGCKGMGTSGMNGFGLDQVGKILGDLMGKLMGQGGGKSDGAQPPPPPTSATGAGGCTQTYQVTQPSTDPCAIYVPNISDSLLTSTSTGSLYDLLDSDSNTNTNTNVSDQLNNTSNTQTDTGTNTNTNTNTNTQTTATVQATTTPTVFSTPAYLISGLRGDIKVLNSGGTVIAGSRDQGSNTEVAGFYGGTAFGGQSTGVIASICRSRPWSSNILSSVLPSNFFDGLCVARGYQVGNVAPAQQTSVTVTQTAPKPIPKATTTTTVKSTSTVPAVPPKVRIWSVPAKVPLGSRASIFWTSQGVTSCSVTSPDGSFSQNTLSGGASTVALTGSTTFTISCLTPDGAPVTDFVTVHLSI